jgi:transposase-like protein
MAKRYSAKLKFQVVTEILSGDKSAAQVAKAYGIHPNTARAWEKTFLKKGPDVFAEDSVVAQYERRIAELEQLVGKKEVEIALLKGFLGSGQ